MKNNLLGESFRLYIGLTLGSIKGSLKYSLRYSLNQSFPNPLRSFLEDSLDDYFKFGFNIINIEEEFPFNSQTKYR